MQDFLNLFNGIDETSINKIQEHFRGKLNIEQIKELLSVLMGNGFVEIIDNKIKLTDRRELETVIKEHSELLRVE